MKRFLERKMNWASWRRDLETRNSDIGGHQQRQSYVIENAA